MAVRIAPVVRQQFFDNQGRVAAGMKVFTYTAATANKLSTYTSSTGGVANANPIVLDSAGRTPSGFWLTDGLRYKIVLAPANDTDPPTSPIWTEDNVGANDATLSDLGNDTDATLGDAKLAVKLVATGTVGTTQHEVNERYKSIFDFLTPAEIADVKAGTKINDLSAKINSALSQFKRILFPNGTYKCAANTGTVLLARDASEGNNLLNYSVYINSYNEIICESRAGVIFDGGWTYGSSAVALTQRTIFAHDSTNLNEFKISPCTIQNAFFGFLNTEANVQCDFSGLYFSGCGFPLYAHYSERSLYDWFEMRSGGAGIVIGGWWASISNTQQEIGGWADKNKFHRIFHIPNVTHGSYENSLDTFFDTYFHKTANNAGLVPGGAGPATYVPFQGVVQSAISIIARYGRPCNNNKFDTIFHSYASRYAIYGGPAIGWGVDNLNIERVGYANKSTLTIFGTTVTNPYVGGKLEGVICLRPTSGFASSCTVRGVQIDRLAAVDVLSGLDQGSWLDLETFTGSTADLTNVPVASHIRSELVALGITPEADGTRDVGSAALAFRELFAKKFTLKQITALAFGARQYSLTFNSGAAFQNHTFSDSSTAGANETISPAGFVMGNGPVLMLISIDRGSFRQWSGARVINRATSATAADSRTNVTTLGTDVADVTAAYNTAACVVAVDDTTGIASFAYTSPFNNAQAVVVNVTIFGWGVV